MPQFRPDRDKDFLLVTKRGKRVRVLKPKVFESFNPSLLGLGNIGAAAWEVQAVAAVFDLGGFTNFCRQIDPQLVVPAYLLVFLNWLFKQIREETKKDRYREGYSLWSDLPFFTKFLGEGMLCLWDTKGMTDVAVCNIG